MKDLFGLKGKSAIIVGGGQGMGESSALFLAEAGCGSAIVDIDADRAKTVADKVKALGCKSTVIIGNILDDSQVEGIFAKAEAEMGGLDILITIVGQALFTSALKVSPADWDMELQRNVRYVFFAAQAFAKLLVKSGKPGVITCIASVSGLQSAPMHSPYGVAKYGLVNLVRSLACEWAQYGIRINAVAPGSIATPRMKALSGFDESFPEVPMKRVGTTDEIGKAVLFLCSDLAAYVTGSTLPVDGGWMAVNIHSFSSNLGATAKK